MVSAFTLFSSLLFGQQQLQTSIPPSFMSKTVMHRPPNYDFDSNARTVFLPHVCQTTAYPSAGGIVLGHFSAVEIAHLNLPRSHPTNRSSSSAEEDDLALRMLSLGAHWWPSWDLYARHQDRILSGIPYDFHFPPVVNVAYPPSGEGLWVFKFSVDERTFDPEDERKPYLPRKPDDWEGSLGMVLSMDERCEALKRFGARFYERLEDCTDLVTTVNEGVVRGREYEELLRKMEDPKYLDRWLEGNDRHCNNARRQFPLIAVHHAPTTNAFLQAEEANSAF